MGQVVIRKLDDAVIAAHKRRAAARGVSLEQQLRDVLAEAAKPSREALLKRMAVCRARRLEFARRREINAAQFDEIAADVARAFVRLVSLDQLIRRGGGRSRASWIIRSTTCLYLALAEAEDLAMITADRRLVGAMRGTALADRVSLLGSLAGR
jgi:plasmid stability protein